MDNASVDETSLDLPEDELESEDGLNPLDFQDEAREIAKGWQMSDAGREAVALALAYRKTKHALYAHAPIVCKGSASPCAPTCPLAEIGVVDEIEGQRCPLEIVSLTEYFNKYCKDLGVDVNNMVDLGLVRELAEVEVQLDRVSNRLAQQDMIVQEPVGVDRRGDPILRSEIHKAVEIQDRLRNRKDKILDQLNATRKAKAKNKEGAIDPSQSVAELLKKAEELEKRRMQANAEISSLPEPPE